MNNINRLPTRAEAIVGLIASLALSSGLGFAIWFIVRAALHRPETLPSILTVALVIFSLLFAWSSALFFRILLGRPQLPSFKGQAAMGYAMVAVGTLLCVGPLLFTSGRSAVYFLQGIVALSLGAVWAYQARKAARARA